MRSGGNPRPSKGDDVRLIWSVGIIYVRQGVYRCVCGGERDREDERGRERANKWKKRMPTGISTHTQRGTHNEAIGGNVVGGGGGRKAGVAGGTC